MQNIIIEEAKYTPSITLDTSGIIAIKGKSYPENTFEFYAPVMQWVEEYLLDPGKNLIVNIEIIYFNSSSSKLFCDFFDLLEENKDKHTIEINWIYNIANESAKEAGEDFIDDFKALNINLVVKM